MRLGYSTGNLIRLALWGFALVPVLSGGCALRSVPVYRADVLMADPNLPQVDKGLFLSELRLYRGAPYREGGNSISGIDCSGLARAVYSGLGLSLARTVLDQYGQGVPVGRGSVVTGDLVFFGRGSTPTHVGLAVSKHEMMHSSSSRGVVLEDIDAFSKEMRLIGIKRVANVR